MIGQMEAQEIRETRQALGLTQEELANRLGLRGPYAKDTVRAWESGKQRINGPAALALRLVRALSGDPGHDVTASVVKPTGDRTKTLNVWQEMGRALLEALWR